MCKYWSNNRCNMGANCNFAHDERELRAQPDLLATRLCFQFSRKGQCKNGDACKYAHGKTELRRMPADKKAKLPQELQTRQTPVAPVQAELLPSHLAFPVNVPMVQAPPGLALEADEKNPPTRMYSRSSSLGSSDPLDLPLDLPMSVDLKSLNLKDETLASYSSDSMSTAASTRLPEFLSEPASPTSPHSVCFWL